jgi:hypothetical protein
MQSFVIRTFSWLIPFCFLLLPFPVRPHAQSPEVRFELVQPESFARTGGMPNAWADFDSDGDLDLFVGFRGGPNRLYRNDRGSFTDVATDVNLADSNATGETRAAAWGDFDADGDADLYVGFANAPNQANKIYRNDKGRFTDVAASLGIDIRGVSRQPAWIDYDGDGDLDLFAAFRDAPNRLFRNDGSRFTDVTKEAGVGDPRKTVGAAWWDADSDGDLDLFVANQEGDANGFFRNERGVFSDVAREVRVDAAGRPKDEGGVGPAIADFDHDGDIDLFVANYGSNALYRNDGGHFTDIAPASGIAGRAHITTAAWGDVNADGWPDVYLDAIEGAAAPYRDALFVNGGAANERGGWRFTDAFPQLAVKGDATHGVQWVDFDGDGRLDLALASNDPKTGTHALLRNTSAQQGRLLEIHVVDARGRPTLPGAEVRVYLAGTRTLFSSGLVDSGSGYCSQNLMPVFVAAPQQGAVDVEVTIIARGRHRTRVADVASTQRTVTVRTRK